MTSSNQKGKNSFSWVATVMVSILLINSSSLCFSQNAVWTVTDNPSSSHEEAKAICSDENYIYVASFDSLPGDEQWKIQKRNKVNGSVIWDVNENPSSSNEKVKSIICDDGYLYMAGWDSSPGHEQWRVQKRNKFDGSIVWTVSEDPHPSVAAAITCDNNYVYIAGYENHSVGNNRWRIQKLNKSDGSVVWDVNDNLSSLSDKALGISSDDSSIYIAGFDYSPGSGNDRWRIQKRNKSDGSVIWDVNENPSSSYDEAHAIACDNSYVYVAGYDSSPGSGDYQWRIQKRDKSNGSIVWTETDNLSSSLDEAYTITCDDKYIYVAGYDSSPGNCQWRIQKRAKCDGSIVWNVNENPSSSDDRAWDITSDNTYIYLAGHDSLQGNRQWKIQKREKQIVVKMDWVTVGDAGNAADTEVMSDGTSGYGSVSYVYRIGKYEVTNGQYIQFLNAVAKTDNHGLYNNTGIGGGMPGTYGGVERTGTVGNYVYGLKNDDPNWLNKPVNFVSFYDALRFCNWLHNEQPSGLQDDSTTEDGAYDIDGDLTTHKSDARVWLPTEDEWYKAAYYKGGCLNAGLLGLSNSE